MGDGRRRRKNVQKKAAPLAVTKIEDIPGEILEVVLRRLTSPPDIVHAAFTCRRWRSIIRGAWVSHVVGYYRVKERRSPSLYAQLPPGRNPVFIPCPSPSPWADIIATRNLGLDFLPRTEYGCSHWELTDVRGGLLLLLHVGGCFRCNSVSEPGSPLVICDPLARHYRPIPRSAWFHGRDFMGAFLLDGDGEDASPGISLSNFRVTCAISGSGSGPSGDARACMFSSIGRRWTSVSTEFVPGLRGNLRFGGCSDDGSTVYWTNGGVGILVALYKEAGKLSSSVMLDKVKYDALRDKHHATEYAYHLRWPPMIRACLP